MKYAVVAAMDHCGYVKNEIISIHRDYKDAERACRELSVRRISEAPDHAKKGDNIRRLEIDSGS
ncbi:MAG: hypothetical protein MN733_33285 [Nitrososphaera sp.]|nr:hypothetical protein [Nitrososphaera sp.]